jgi:hypothetical protein
MGEAKQRRENGGTIRRVPEPKMRELRELQAAAEEAAAAVRVAQAKAQIALEAFAAKVRELLKEQGAPVTHTIDPESGAIAPPAAAGGR